MAPIPPVRLLEVRRRPALRRASRLRPAPSSRAIRRRSRSDARPSTPVIRALHHVSAGLARRAASKATSAKHSSRPLSAFSSKHLALAGRCALPGIAGAGAPAAAYADAAARARRSGQPAPGACAPPACRGGASKGRRGARPARLLPPVARVFSNIAWVSVGKPAIRSAPKAMPGLSARSLSAERQHVGAAVAALHALEHHDRRPPARSSAGAASAGAPRRRAFQARGRSPPGRWRRA